MAKQEYTVSSSKGDFTFWDEPGLTEAQAIERAKMQYADAKKRDPDVESKKMFFANYISPAGPKTGRGIAQALYTPARVGRAIGVSEASSVMPFGSTGVPSGIPGVDLDTNKLLGSLGRAKEALKPGFQPQGARETIGANLGEMAATTAMAS